MDRWTIALVLSAAMLLSACGGPATQGTVDQAATTVASSELEDTINSAATAVSDPNLQGTIDEAATAVADPAVGTTVSEAIDELSAVADDTVIQQGQQLLLDASQSVGDIKDFKWTIQQTPQGAESVQGTTISEGMTDTLALTPEEYAKFFPVAGTYTVRLTITNGAGQTSYDDFQVEVP